MYDKVSGQMINRDKSSILFSLNTSTSVLRANEVDPIYIIRSKE
jgi:hypothetical protein